MLLYQRTYALEALLQHAPGVLDQDNEHGTSPDVFVGVVVSPHRCVISTEAWEEFLQTVTQKHIPAYVWVVADSTRPAARMWVRSMKFPLPVRWISPPDAALRLSVWMGEDFWNRIPAIFVVYRGRVVWIAPLWMEGRTW